jgi:hypothetical protein
MLTLIKNSQNHSIVVTLSWTKSNESETLLTEKYDERTMEKIWKKGAS